MDKEKAREFINLVHRGRPVVAVTTPAALSSGRFTLVRADDYDRMEKIAEKDGGRLICFCAQVKPETLPDAGADCRRQINMSDDSIKKIFEDGCSDWIPITVNGIDFDSSKRAGNVICRRLAEMGLKNPVVYAAGTACVALYRFDDFAPANNFMTTLRLYFPAVAGGTMYDFMRPIPVPGTAGVSGIAHGKLIGINDSAIPASIADTCGLKPLPKATWADVPGGFNIMDYFPGTEDKNLHIRRASDNEYLMIQDTRIGTVGVWGGIRFEKLIYEKLHHPVTVPAPVRLNEAPRPEKILSAKAIREAARRRPPKQKLPTGFTMIDDAIGGLPMGGLLIVTAYTGAGKSILASQMILNLIEKGYKAVLWSGEMDDVDVLDVLTNQAAGKENLMLNPNDSTEWIAPSKVEDMVDTWLDGRLGIYNNEHTFEVDELLAACKKACEDMGAHILILDNLMMLDTDGTDKWAKQETIVKKLKKFATNTGLTVLLVAHTRKMQGLIGIDDILGASEIVKLADAVIATYKITDSFKRAYSERYKLDKKEDDDAFIEREFKGATNAMSLLKARRGELQDDVFSGLYYEKGSRRLLNRPGEQLFYGWQDKPRTTIYTQQTWIEDADKTLRAEYDSKNSGYTTPANYTTDTCHI